MKEPYEEGVAIHSAPSFAPEAAKLSVKRKQGHRWAGLSSFENLQSGRQRCHHCGRQHDRRHYRELPFSPA
jgi:hypothetical protein